MKLGSMIIPDTSLEVCLSVTTEIYQRSKGKEISRAQIADYLEQARGGAFNKKIASCKRYGLIEGRKDTYRITEVGQHATVPRDNEERQAAILKAVRNIELWKKLLDMEVTPASVNFWHYLEDITGVDRSVAKNEANAVRKAYLKDVELIKSAGEPQKDTSNDVKEDTRFAGRTSNMIAQSAPNMIAQSTDPTTAVVTIDYPRYQARIEINDKDYDSYKLVLDHLNAVKKSLNITEAEVSNNEILDMLAAINLTLKLKEEREQAASQNKGEREDITSGATQGVR